MIRLLVRNVWGRAVEHGDPFDWVARGVRTRGDGRKLLFLWAGGWARLPGLAIRVGRRRRVILIGCVFTPVTDRRGGPT
jgi:hypothetical protein